MQTQLYTLRGSAVDWLKDQIYHFNLLNLGAIVVVVCISQWIEKKSTDKEIKTLAEEIYKNAEELKDEIRTLR